MNKKELITAVVEKTMLSKVDTKKTLENIIEVISTEMQKDGKIIVLGFGTFSVKTKAARTSVNPQTGQLMELPAKKYVRFKPSNQLNNLLVLKKKKGRPRIEKL